MSDTSYIYFTISSSLWALQTVKLRELRPKHDAQPRTASMHQRCTGPSERFSQNWDVNWAHLFSRSIPHFRSPFKVTQFHQNPQSHTDRSVTHDFLFTFHSNHGPISYRFRDKRRFQKIKYEIKIIKRDQRISDDRWLTKTDSCHHGLITVVISPFLLIDQSINQSINQSITLIHAARHTKAYRPTISSLNTNSINEGVLPTQYAAAPACGDFRTLHDYLETTLNLPTILCICARDYCNFCHFRSIFVNLFARWRTCYGLRFESEASLTRDLITLTFDLSTSKWCHRSPVSWASFLSIFSLLHPSILDLGSGTGQIDRRTDRRRPPTLNAPRYGADQA